MVTFLTLATWKPGSPWTAKCSRNVCAKHIQLRQARYRYFTMVNYELLDIVVTPQICTFWHESTKVSFTVYIIKKLDSEAILDFCVC